jgi:hypothetical protein
MISKDFLLLLMITLGNLILIGRPVKEKIIRFFRWQQAIRKEGVLYLSELKLYQCLKDFDSLHEIFKYLFRSIFTPVKLCPEKKNQSSANIGVKAEGSRSGNSLIDLFFGKKKKGYLSESNMDCLV